MGMGLRQLLPPMRGRESGGTQVNVLLQRRQKFLGPDGNRTSSFGVLVFDHLKFKLQVETNGAVFWGSKSYVETKKESGMAGIWQPSNLSERTTRRN